MVLIIFLRSLMIFFAESLSSVISWPYTVSHKCSMTLVVIYDILKLNGNLTFFDFYRLIPEIITFFQAYPSFEGYAFFYFFRINSNVVKKRLI